jgi:hypothetical protein
MFLLTEHHGQIHDGDLRVLHREKADNSSHVYPRES